MVPMPTPDFIVSLREKIGHDQLFLPSVTAVIVRAVPTGSAIWELPSVLLAQRADNGTWGPISGICEPGEEITTTALREVKEEIGLDGCIEALLGVGQVGPVVCPNGDKCMYMDTAIRVSVPDDAEPVISDEENIAAQWFSVAQMPTSVNARHRMIIGDAVAQMKHPQGFRPRMGYVKRSS